jgi:hypothetical protein
MQIKIRIILVHDHSNSLWRIIQSLDKKTGLYIPLGMIERYAFNTITKFRVICTLGGGDFDSVEDAIKFVQNTYYDASQKQAAEEAAAN